MSYTQTSFQADDELLKSNPDAAIKYTYTWLCPTVTYVVIGEY